MAAVGGRGLKGEGEGGRKGAVSVVIAQEVTASGIISRRLSR